MYICAKKLYKGELMKEIQLRNGQTLIIEPARLEHAKQFADYANKIKTETNFILKNEII